MEEVPAVLSYLQQVLLSGSPYLWLTLSCIYFLLGSLGGCYSNSWQQIVLPRQSEMVVCLVGSFPNRFGLNRLEGSCRDRDIPISDLGPQWAVPRNGAKAQAAV